MDVHDSYEAYRPLLHSIAYRMLGTNSEAEDAVQDVFADYIRHRPDEVNNEKAYLIRMLTNRCLNLLQSARKRREVYTGNWLPEPDVSLVQQDPAELYDRNETISYGLLVMLEQLSAVERAVFILRESLQYEYSEIAYYLQKSEANCRKIYSRAKSKLMQNQPALPAPSAAAEPLAAAFIAAARSGDFDALVELLTEEAALVTDGGGKVRAAIFPILGRDRVLAFLKGVIPRGLLGEDNRFAAVNGQTGIILMENGQVKSVLSFQIDEQQGKADKIFILANPEKLGHIR
ncbi:RNA polymerase sigma-70 factor [Paenibacillus harenae]|uniref:RNA polymerase sigma-70 factor n=1 Tax=Paenibacillus harenae TaxID=306543 RepID=UPI000421F431|nr:RNA polymerase sigma-70 factor [Paenibacillus harenae]